MILVLVLRPYSFPYVLTQSFTVRERQFFASYNDPGVESYFSNSPASEILYNLILYAYVVQCMKLEVAFLSEPYVF